MSSAVVPGLGVASLAVPKSSRWTLAFANDALEREFRVECAASGNGSLARRFMGFVSLVVGVFFFGVYLPLGWNLGALVETTLVCSLLVPASVAVLASKTAAGRRRQATLAAIAAFCLFCLVSASSCANLLREAPGRLREPYAGGAVPVCAAADLGPVAISATVFPWWGVEGVNFTERHGRYEGRACFVRNAAGEAQVVESRVWAPGTYNFEIFALGFAEGFTAWARPAIHWRTPTARKH